MRFSLTPLIIGLTIGCTPKDVADPNDNADDTGSDYEPDDVVVWDDKRHGTSVTFQDGFTNGTELFVVTTEGQTWKHQDDTWTNLPLNVDEENLNGIWGTGTGATLKMVGVGAAGTIITWTGETWEATQDSTSLFQAVDGESSTDLIAVGGAGPWRNAGGEWTSDAEFGHEKFSDVWYDGTTGIAVGDDGKIAWFVDDEWSIEDVGVDTDLYSIDAISPGDVWVAGARGTLLHFNGTAWQSIDLDTQANMWDVWTPSANVVYVVGANGHAYKVQGTLVERLHTGVNNILYSVTGTTEANVWATGGRGVALHYTGG